MIPNIIHYVFGLDPRFGGKEFSFIHYLAVRSAAEVNKPQQIIFHYEFEPTGPWWEATRPYLTLNPIVAPRQIFGRPLEHFAHRADIVRLEALRESGGIYLDLDVLCVNSLASLCSESMVMGIEQNVGLCNAVILAEPRAPFLDLWYERYRDFSGTQWNKHSVVVPWELAQQHPSLIRVLDEYAFFFPVYYDPMHKWLWGRNPTLKERLLTAWYDLGHLPRRDAKSRRRHLRSRHCLRSRRWFDQKLRSSYCIHLWESLWWNDYLRDLDPHDPVQSHWLFWELVRDIIPIDSLPR